MFYLKINTFLEKVCEQIKYKPIRKTISEELEQHLLEIKEEKILENFLEEEAEAKATEQMGEPEQIGKKLNKIHRPKLDWQLFILVMILVFFGVFNIIFKTTAENDNLSEDMMSKIVGLIIGIFIYFGNYKKLQKFSNIIYFIATAMNVLAFTSMFGRYEGYLYLPLISKPISIILIVMLYIMAFVGFLVDSKEKKIKEIVILDKKISIQINGMVKVISSSLIALILVGTLPSIPNVILLGITYLTIGTIYVWKVSRDKKKIISILCGGLVIVGIALIAGNSEGMLIERARHSLTQQVDAQEMVYVGTLQKEIIENSKMIGQANTEIIHETENIISQESNYTFVYLMGKLGIVAIGVLVTVIILIAIKIILNAKLVKDMYGKMIIIGLGTLYILQSVINILMNINLGIQTNVNLPFVCEGNLYFIINCISMAFILSIYRRKDINLETIQ